MPDKQPALLPWWASSLGSCLTSVGSSPQGLGSAQVVKQRQRCGPNRLRDAAPFPVLRLLMRQLGSPMVLILLGAALLSFAMHEATDGLIILVIIAISSMLGFWQEFHAASAVRKLQGMVELRAEVLRDGQECTVPVEQVVPGDVLLLSAGASVCADSRLLAARDLFANEATLTGETFPVEKIPGELPADTPLAQRSNAIFQGTHIVSGTGRALVMSIGRNTEFGAIAQHLRTRPPETDFEQGVRAFGNLLIRITLVLVILIFAINVFLQRPVLDSFLFALALAVGLIPELLPAIISVNLASGARRMAASSVIVKRLVSIENFGSMDVLCADKTGTLTEGTVQLQGALDTAGLPSQRVLMLAGLNASFQTGFRNQIDAAIVAAAGKPAADAVRLDEIPYDFSRKRLSVLAQAEGRHLMVTKGAIAQVWEACTDVAMGDGLTAPMATQLAALQMHYANFSTRGLRTLGLAVKLLPGRNTIGRDDETGMTFVGFILFADPPKADIAQTLQTLKNLGITLKVITGDNALVAREITRQIGLGEARIITGSALRQVGDDALPRLASQTDVFAEVEPNQKERIIRALRQAGHVVGYLGDGINDAPALHAADVGISVQGAADVAKDAADIVLLEHNLAVLASGVREGRITFANTLKYVFMATSANFGNMFSMAGASLLLPFLPLLPNQILLTNLLTDLPEMAIASDRVDPSAIDRPHRWDVHFIRSFMLHFGLLSSVFDFLTFGVLYLALQASPALFRSGWFVESVASATLVALVVRTRGPFWRSRPSRGLALCTLLVLALAVALPYSALASMLGFAALPLAFLGWMGLIVLSYLACAEGLKRHFYRRHRLRRSRGPRSYARRM